MTTDERSPSRQYPVASFFVLTFILSYFGGVIAAIILQMLLPESLKDSADVVAKFGPTFAGIIMAGVVAGKVGVKRLFDALLDFRIPPGWYGYALLLPFVIMILSLAIFQLNGGTLETAKWNTVALNSLLLLIPLKIFLGGGLGEELGWRGFALPQLQKRMSAFRASLLIWVVWTVWHFPAFFLASSRDGEMPIWMFTIFVFAVTTLFTWAYNMTNGNLLIPVVFHGTANASESLLELLVPLAERVTALGWLTGIYSLIALIILLVYPLSRLSSREKVVWKADDTMPASLKRRTI